MPPKSAFASDAEYIAYLRDWFAGQALAAIAGLHHGNDWGPDGKDHAPRCARKAYAIADAMLATRTGSAEQ
jgi:hypothetical protein